MTVETHVTFYQSGRVVPRQGKLFSNDRLLWTNGNLRKYTFRFSGGPYSGLNPGTDRT